MNTIPRRSELESIAKRACAIDYALVGVLVLLDAGLIWRTLATGDGHLLMISAVLLGISSTIHLAGMLQFFTKPGRRVKHLKLPETVGRFSAGDVKGMVAELLKPHTGRELPAIFITESKYDGAFVINSLFFNFLKRLNAVYISRYLFQILEPAEIKAILAHELAHFYKYMHPLGRTRFALMVFNALLPVQLLQPGRILSPAGVIFSWLVLSIVFIRGLHYWFNRHARTHEYLCDLHSARRYGILNVVNSLLGVMKTSEVQYIIQARLLRAIRDDDTLSMRELPKLFELIDQRLPPGPLSANDIERAIAQALASPEANQLRKAQSKSEEDHERRQVESLVEAFLMNKTFDLFDWATFDNVRADGRVDAHEYPCLIRMLEQEKDKQLFALPTDHAPTVRNGSHPTVRERILFLEKCRLEDGTVALAGAI